MLGLGTSPSVCTSLYTRDCHTGASISPLGGLVKIQGAGPHSQWVRGTAEPRLCTAHQCPVGADAADPRISSREPHDGYSQENRLRDLPSPHGWKVTNHQAGKLSQGLLGPWLASGPWWEERRAPESLHPRPSLPPTHPKTCPPNTQSMLQPKERTQGAPGLTVVDGIDAMIKLGCRV